MLLMNSFQRIVVMTFLVVSLTGAVSPASAQDEGDAEIVIKQGLVINSLGRGGRRPVHTDALEALIVRGEFSAPEEGDEIELPDGESRTWQAISAGDNGSFSHRALRGGYFYASVESAVERVMLLEAAGHSTVYVNGQPRAGDPYRTNWLRLPVKLHPGTNDFLFHCSRGSVSAKLVEPTSEIMFAGRDSTLPHLLEGQKVDTYGSVMIINATDEALTDLNLVSILNEGLVSASAPTTTPLAVIGPLTSRRVPFRLRADRTFGSGLDELKLSIQRSVDDEIRTIATSTFNLAGRDPAGSHNRTFISSIDNSVQYYAVVPAIAPAEDDEDPSTPGLVLTLHGAGVHAPGQANSYRAKKDVHIVAPTNRRHFGFDWEDWGRWDALEVLDLALKQFENDPARTYLTGHSMGGHGAWHVGVTFPDRFAAISPSAAWISFWSYTGAAQYENASPIEQILTRATSASDTLALARNYLQHGVFITHGDRDNNVPVAQARTMRAKLAEFHGDFGYYERPGAGHWWGVDFEPMFDFFRHHTIPSVKNHIEFITASPGVSASNRWLTIETQQQAYGPSSVDIRYDPDARSFTGTTNNVERLSIDLSTVEAGDPISIELDGMKIENPIAPAGTDRVWLSRAGDDDVNNTWRCIGVPSPDGKSPQRSGAFKDAFRNHMMFVYGTNGSAEENAWAYAKARYDAETFGYRGNGSIDVIADVDFDPAGEPDRNVILYGNADSNSAWQALFSTSPVQVTSSSVIIGERRMNSSELGCLLIRPRPGSDSASVAAVTGSGIVGLRLTDRLPYFVSGVAYPDCIVIDPSVLEQGVDGVRAAGFFGNDWSIEAGDFAFQP